MNYKPKDGFMIVKIEDKNEALARVLVLVAPEINPEVLAMQATPALVDEFPSEIDFSANSNTVSGDDSLSEGPLDRYLDKAQKMLQDTFKGSMAGYGRAVPFFRPTAPVYAKAGDRLLVEASHLMPIPGETDLALSSAACCIVAFIDDGE